MAAPSAHAPFVRATAAVPLWQEWRQHLSWRQRLQARQADLLTCACFGGLRDLDRAILSGLVAARAATPDTISDRTR